MANTTIDKRTPLKAPPLRQAGESVEQQIQRILDDQAAGWMFLLVAPPVLTLLLVVFWWLGVTLPYVVAGFALVSVVMTPISIIRLLRYKREIKNLKLGRDGERLVGRYLDEQLIGRGYRVFHDIVVEFDGRNTFNIDHVAIGPGGIFVIETKTRSKPTIGDPVVEYDGEAVRVADGPLDEAPIRQVSGAAQFVHDLLRETTGHDAVPVRPVVVYPGWWIEGRSGGKTVWVLEPKVLPKWLANERDHLSGEQIALYADRLSRYIRDHQRRGI